MTLINDLDPLIDDILLALIDIVWLGRPHTILVQVYVMWEDLEVCAKVEWPCSKQF